jgi:hypothetical protein
LAAALFYFSKNYWQEQVILLLKRQAKQWKRYCNYCGISSSNICLFFHNAEDPEFIAIYR